MVHTPDRRGTRLRPLIALLGLGAVITSLSAIALSGSPPVSLWLVGVAIVVLNTILIYRLGRLSERARSHSLPDFFRGLKQGLMSRPDGDGSGA